MDHKVSLYFPGPVVYLYYSILQREESAPSNLPAVLLYVLQRKEDLDKSKIENQEGRFNSFLRNSCILKTIFIFLPTAYPLGVLCALKLLSQPYLKFQHSFNLEFGLTRLLLYITTNHLPPPPPQSQPYLLRV